MVKKTKVRRKYEIRKCEIVKGDNEKDIERESDKKELMKREIVKGDNNKTERGKDKDEDEWYEAKG